jgi:hypothetical protein
MSDVSKLCRAAVMLFELWPDVGHTELEDLLRIHCETYGWDFVNSQIVDAVDRAHHPDSYVEY